MHRIVTPKIHTAPRRLDFQVAFESDKRASLLNTLRSVQTNAAEPDADVKRTIVFCNARETVREVYEFLKAEEDIHAKAGDPLHFELIPFTRDNYDRHSALERFNEKSPSITSSEPSDSTDQELMQKWRKEEESNSKALRVLITTDMASRGLDTLGCKTLVLYDIPFSNIDLLHRLGRTARAGKRGKAIMLVSKAEYRGRTREWVNEIRDRVIKGEALV
jgi:ATP-dependent RNA helicase MRH4